MVLTLLAHGDVDHFSLLESVKHTAVAIFAVTLIIAFIMWAILRILNKPITKKETDN